MKKLPILLLLMTTLFLACSDDMDMQEEEEIGMSVDITTAIIGSYLGDISVVGDSASFTESDRTATATTSSDSIANIRITSLSGTISLIASMTSETTFGIEDATLYDEGPYAGTGNLDGDTITINLTSEDFMFSFVGTK